MLSSIAIGLSARLHKVIPQRHSFVNQSTSFGRSCTSLSAETIKRLRSASKLHKPLSIHHSRTNDFDKASIEVFTPGQSIQLHVDSHFNLNFLTIIPFMAITVPRLVMTFSRTVNGHLTLFTLQQVDTQLFSTLFAAIAMAAASRGARNEPSFILTGRGLALNLSVLILAPRAADNTFLSANDSF